MGAVSTESDATNQRGRAVRPAALPTLFDQHFEQTVRLAHLLGAEDPEDVAQEAFVRLHLRWSRLRDTERALAYLNVIVLNLTRSHFRRNLRSKAISSERQADAKSAELEALGADDQEPILAALNTLTVRQRQVVVLRYWLDLSIDDIAERLRVSPGTVKATLSQAGSKLRIALKEG